MPPWSKEIIDLYESGAASQFILHGNISDRVLLPKSAAGPERLGSLTEYLRESLLVKFDVVLAYDLGNGARVEHLNWAGDPSAKGLKQSYGLMVNYLYDLKRLDKHRTLLAQGRVAVSGEMEDWLS